VTCRRWQYDTEATLSELRAEVECEPPNNSLYTFTGNLQLAANTFGLTTNQVPARGPGLSSAHAKAPLSAAPEPKFHPTIPFR